MTEPLTQKDKVLPVTSAPDQLRKRLTLLGWWKSVPHTAFAAHWLDEGEHRLDATYYAREGFAARRALSECGFELKRLDDIVQDIFILGRFRRIYATDSNAGWPYLSASEALTFRPVSNRWIAKDYAPRKSKKHFAKRGWILMSCSGTVGRAVIATKRLEAFFLTHDLARIVPKGSPPVGYVYAYLSCWIGQALLRKDQYGSAIKHLEAHHIAGVPVPLVGESQRQTIHDQVARAYSLREEANDLLDEADEMLHSELGLQRFDESLVPYLPVARQETAGLAMPHPRAFVTRVSELAERLDASYHVPIARTAVGLLGELKYQPSELKDLAQQVIVPPRFKRVYVPKEHGVPFLQGSHVAMMKPYDLKYLSRAHTKRLDRWIVRAGWVLVTCSGTVGRVSVVSSFQDRWAASQHILRIVSAQDRSHPGYLAAFLMTPYGRHQVAAKVYGAVVDELTENDMAAVLIPQAPLELQTRIGKRVVSAFEKKDEATEVEEAAIRRLETLLAAPRAGRRCGEAALP